MITKARLLWERFRQTSSVPRMAEQTAELARANEALQTETSRRQRAEELLRESEQRFNTDISERVRMEESLRESKERLQHLVSSNPAVIFALKFEESGVDLSWISDNHRRFTGHDPEEDTSRAWWLDHVHPDDRERVIAAEAPFTSERQTTEYRFRRKDGTYFWIRDEKALIRDAAGKPLEMIGSLVNISEQKGAEEALRLAEARMFQSQKLETVGKLAGGIAHEFNSIMTAIIGQSELLLEDLPQANPLRGNAMEIRKAADRAVTLTRQLLAYGRKQILQPEILNLNAVLAGMENVLRHLTGRGVDLRITPCASLQTVKVDAGQIEQVIMNMAMNAVDAMPNGGKLTLETANATLDQEYVSHFPELKAGEYVMLAITDTGAGMSKEVEGRIFDPFFSTKGAGRGTGLGLATSYGILKQSGGHISVYSEPGRGASFKIYLPQVAEPPAHPIKAAEAPGMPGGRESILLVEDDPGLREMAGALLQRLGYTVWIAANGIEALGVANLKGRGHIDLLFTDVVMPHMSGKELADRVRSLSPSTLVLFTSAYTENAIVHQGMLNDGVAILQKPFTPLALACKVREMLDGEISGAVHGMP